MQLIIVQVLLVLLSLC